MGVHPYKYTTNNSFYWRNYHYWVPYDNPCLVLGMFNIWTTTQYLAGEPIIFTEVNWYDRDNNTTNKEAYLFAIIESRAARSATQDRGTDDR